MDQLWPEIDASVWDVFTADTSKQYWFYILKRKAGAPSHPRADVYVEIPCSRDPVSLEPRTLKYHPYAWAGATGLLDLSGSLDLSTYRDSHDIWRRVCQPGVHLAAHFSEEQPTNKNGPFVHSVKFSRRYVLII